MARAEIPDWFDLQAYQPPLSHDQWGVSISMRADYLNAKPMFYDTAEQEELFRYFGGRMPEEFGLADRHTDPFPVRTMIAADLAVISASWSEDQSWQALFQKVCSVVGKAAPSSLLKEVVAIYENASSLNSEAVEKVGWLAPEFCHGVPITVDLDNDDETLKLAFSVWLAGVRSGTTERFKKPISEDDFQKWHKFRILAAFDLYQWAEIKGIRFTNNQIANALFPPASVSIEDRDIDMGERVRKVVKPLMEQSITAETVRLIRATTRLEKFLGQAVENHQQQAAAYEPESKSAGAIPESGGGA
ncbi:DUF6387 family protein [Pseudomonas sp. 10B1]|uniref:DUF6387 family protein n=1 Tax=unclassified Pseudomonas TaxID=196821 RepID=UPI002B239979|nr:MULTISPECIES: DUF6387 family protein [unclassified Pseudomonas]MEA9996298.1 DUF6387 family protein [Pseudomonas sp. AA4]MEB0086660.1 DUF6387 family protein [Pseudomonas sp. RTI1]MEB0124710.1 DUF6387 family protein [Pseudomonas sp. CCC1.2]MEB0154974.1 DUF6387 family protein [Pseudomonas sp. CCC4.3]MEB0217917.1 DUF6387 family protein [Pseudomonas sp. AB12(2023)]